MIEKRKQPFVIAGFVISIGIFVIFLLISIVKIYPTMIEIQDEKATIKEMVDNYTVIKSKGINYDEFEKQKLEGKSNIYLQNILDEVDYKFFTKNFVNESGGDFNTFFSKKIKEINDKKNSDEYKYNTELYKKILPSYVEVDDQNEIGVMTDFKFVTYLESILHTFNLNSNDKSISVGNLNILPDYSSTSSKGSGLDTTIFYIPYTFNVNGTKKDILDFIYFLENVGSIRYSDSNNTKIDIYKDNFINKTLVGFNNSNILENPVADIQKVTFPEYIDSSLSNREENSFIDFIKTTQGNEKIDVSIEVRFYVKGLPNYKIVDAISKLTERYNLLKVSYTKALSNFKNDSNIKTSSINLEKGLKYLQELDTTVKNIKAAKGDLNLVYKQVLEVNKLLDILDNLLSK